MRQLLLVILIILFSEHTFSQVKVDTISICSFNIQFLGHFKARDNNTLSEVLKPYDIVVIQEMVAPPVSGTFPSNGQKHKPYL